MGGLNKLLGQIATYGLSSVLIRAVNFLLVPLYTAFLLPEQYGQISYLYAWAAFLNVILSLGIDTAYFRYGSAQPADEKSTYTTALQLIVVWSVLVLGLIGLSLYLPFWSGSMVSPFQVHLLLQILGTDALLLLPFARLRLLGKTFRFVMLKSGQVLLTLVLNLWWIYMPGSGVAQLPTFLPSDPVALVLLANLFANVLILLVFLPDYRTLASPWVKEHASRLIKYGWPLMLMGFAGMINEVLDRLLLEFWLPEGFYSGLSTPAVIGIYSGCYKLAILITLGIQAFRYAVEPFFFNEFKNQGALEKYSHVMHLYIISACLAMLFIETNLDLLKLLLRNDIYYLGLEVVPYLLLANVLLGVFFNLSAWYKLKDKTMAGTWLTMMGALITIVANFLLIPVLGMKGAAISTLLCYSGMVLLSYVWGKNQLNVPYRLVSGLLYLSISAGITFWLALWPFSWQYGRLVFGWLAILGMGVWILMAEKPFSKRGIN